MKNSRGIYSCTRLLQITLVIIFVPCSESQYRKLEVGLLEFIGGHKDKLKLLIEFDGLVGELKTRRLLSDRQVLTMCNLETDCHRVGRLLDIVSTYTEKQCHLFLDALNKNNQQHVVNYIKNKGGKSRRVDDRCK